MKGSGSEDPRRGLGGKPSGRESGGGTCRKLNSAPGTSKKGEMEIYSMVLERVLRVTRARLTTEKSTQHYVTRWGNLFQLKDDGGACRAELLLTRVDGNRDYHYVMKGK